MVDTEYLANKHKPPVGKPVVNKEELDSREKQKPPVGKPVPRAEKAEETSAKEGTAAVKTETVPQEKPEVKAEKASEKPEKIRYRGLEKSGERRNRALKSEQAVRINRSVVKK